MEPHREGGDERPRDPDEGLSNLARAYHKVGPYLNLGWSIALPPVGLTLAGAWLDGRLNTSPVFVLTGALLGLGIGFTVLYKTFTRQK